MILRNKIKYNNSSSIHSMERMFHLMSLGIRTRKERKHWRLNLRFMLVFDILKNGSSTLNFNCSDNIARIIKCYISKSKLALSTCNGVYFSSTTLIVFTLYEIKQINFLGDTQYHRHRYIFRK